MSDVLIVPPFGDRHWPTLGPAVVAFIEQNLVHGPGDLLGEPAQVDGEKFALICRMYEVYPQDHPQAGRRRFKRVGLSLRKGSAKTELAAWLAACELHPEGPVRVKGWTANGEPIGGGVTDPYIPLVAYTQEQSSDLAYTALLAIIEGSPLADDFDVGLSRITRRDGSGKAQALSNAPGARDGARTTFQVFDETHRLTLPSQKAAHQTMLLNIPKRKMADGWSLEVTTAYSPGENSVAEDTMDYARTIEQGKIDDPRLFFFHRQAGERHKDLQTREQIRAAVIEASGPVAAWSDIESIVDLFQDPKADRPFLERVWLNRPIQQTRKAFDVAKWKALARPSYQVPTGSRITLGFDGGRFFDGSALVGCEIASGYLFLLGLWEQPAHIKDNREHVWEVPAAEVDSAIAAAFEKWNVWRFYADPPHWQGKLDEWVARHGEEQVISWLTSRDKPMSNALGAFTDAIATGELSHDGDERLANHVGNAVRRELRMRDEEGKPLFCVQKERPDSLFKIDALMAAVLAFEARGDAIKSGVLDEEEPQYQCLFVGGGGRK